MKLNNKASLKARFLECIKPDFIHNKRGIELSLNMVVIIAIVLIVLIVAVIIFSGGAQEFVTKLKEINAQIWVAKPDLTGGV